MSKNFTTTKSVGKKATPAIVMGVVAVASASVANVQMQQNDTVNPSTKTSSQTPENTNPKIAQEKPVKQIDPDTAVSQIPKNLLKEEQPPPPATKTTDTKTETPIFDATMHQTISEATSHIVAAGETLLSIAQKYNLSLEQLISYNELSNSNMIFVGQTINLKENTATKSVLEVTQTPQPEHVKTPENFLPEQPPTLEEILPEQTQILEQPETKEVANNLSSTIEYVVKQGDTLSKIANTHNVSIENIQHLNPQIKENFLIHTGEILIIPAQNQVFESKPTETTPIVNENSNTQNNKPQENNFSQQSIKNMVIEIAQNLGFNKHLALAIAEQESGFQAHVVSSSNAVGVMQLLPSTAAWIAANPNLSKEDLFDPQTNITLGIKYLQYLFNQQNNDKEKAIASYFQGPGAVSRNGISEAGRNYVKSVLEREQRFTALF